MGRFSDAGDRRLALSFAAFGAALAAGAVALFGHVEHVPLAGGEGVERNDGGSGHGDGGVRARGEPVWLVE